MREEDLTIFDYRCNKEKQLHDIILEEQKNTKSKKICVRTDETGWIDAYIYYPTDSENDYYKTIINFHGGGNVLGFCEVDGKYCQKLADMTKMAVVNVDYALAPEYKFPKPLYSAYDALCKIKEEAGLHRLDMSSISIVGHSAGGYIAVIVGLLDKENKILNIERIVSDYAPLCQDDSIERISVDPTKEMSPERILQYKNWYFEDLSQTSHIYASPIYADLSGFPELFIISAEWDTLKYEERVFAENAHKSGVDVIYKVFSECSHGFTHVEFDGSIYEKAKEAWQDMTYFIIGEKYRINNTEKL